MTGALQSTLNFAPKFGSPKSMVVDDETAVTATFNLTPGQPEHRMPHDHS
jgi:hypothetical protein